MPRAIKATSKQKSGFYIHCVIFAIGTLLSWMLYDKGVKGWAYPWPAWTTAAWALWLLGHWCMVYQSVEDKGYNVYRNQQGKQ